MITPRLIARYGNIRLIEDWNPVCNQTNFSVTTPDGHQSFTHPLFFWGLRAATLNFLTRILRKREADGFPIP